MPVEEEHVMIFFDVEFLPEGGYMIQAAMTPSNGNSPILVTVDSAESEYSELCRFNEFLKTSRATICTSSLFDKQFIESRMDVHNLKLVIKVDIANEKKVMRSTICMT